MAIYIMRLDDASEYMDIEKWNKMEQLLDKYDIKPIYGIIPDNRDSSIVSRYTKNDDFWDNMKRWEAKGWVPAMHGYEHRYVTDNGGINPVNKRSEFAGLSLREQEQKIERGWRILLNHGFSPEIFFAPSHTFDDNTLIALKENTSIRVISDSIAYDIYKKGDFWFVPQQSGNVRVLPFKTVTFCYHPNTMTDTAFVQLEKFLKVHCNKFVVYNKDLLNDRKLMIHDKLLRYVYFSIRH